jgi:hypothetical protein
LSDVLILTPRIETGTGLLDSGEVTVTEDLRGWIVGTQTAEQCRKGTLLGGSAGVCGSAVLIESSFVAYPDTVGIEMAGMGSDLSICFIPEDNVFYTCKCP